MPVMNTFEATPSGNIWKWHGPPDEHWRRVLDGALWLFSLVDGLDRHDAKHPVQSEVE